MEIQIVPCSAAKWSQTVEASQAGLCMGKADGKQVMWLDVSRGRRGLVFRVRLVILNFFAAYPVDLDMITVLNVQVNFSEMVVMKGFLWGLLFRLSVNVSIS